MHGWPLILETASRLRGPGKFSLPAYSEFMPPPRVGLKPTGMLDPHFDPIADPLGWPVSEWEEELEIKPGLEFIGRQINDDLRRLYLGQRPPNLSGPQDMNLRDNPAWPKELAQAAPQLSHERFALLTPLALSRTQDDKGRVRWTLFGSSDLGPEMAFWKSFVNDSDLDKPQSRFNRWARLFLNRAWGLSLRSDEDFFSSGFGVLPTLPDPDFPDWNSFSISTTVDSRLVLPYLAPSSAPRFLLTFTPFSKLPDWARNGYLCGAINLLPCPASLIFWYAPPCRQLQKQLSGALQIPLLRLVARQEALKGLRVPQSGWLREPRGTQELPPLSDVLVKNSFARTNRWNRFQRNQSVLETTTLEEKISQVLFSTDLQSLGLYGKPMARNCQLWDIKHQKVLHGPEATPETLIHAARTLDEGGIFGYRFYYPPMKAGLMDVFWHRPLVAWSPAPGQFEVQHAEAPTGFFRASAVINSRLSGTDLFPRLQRRTEYLSVIREFARTLPSDYYLWQTLFNAYKLLNTSSQLGKLLSHSFSQQLLANNKRDSLKNWLNHLPGKAFSSDAGHELQIAIESRLALENSIEPPLLAFPETGSRAFEEKYWQTIAFLAHGSFKTVNNADVIESSVSSDPTPLKGNERDLDRLADWLLNQYRRMIDEAGHSNDFKTGELPFRWETDFPYPTFGGWRLNQRGDGKERNLLIVIPGRNRSEAVVMADHYDTAYMEDVYDKTRGGDGSRKAAAGADDNYSATAAMLLAAPLFFERSRQGLLERDIWLLHLTGEEFPADCLGARNFCKQVVDGTLSLKTKDGKIPLHTTRITGVVVLDMIAHNRNSDKYVFQISPGEGRESMQLAEQAHVANLSWNAFAKASNRSSGRNARPTSRTADPAIIPDPAPYPIMDGEIRPEFDPRSSLFNTDGQIFSDVGIPVILLMENYDISRQGYHDTRDTMENIDLDYGSALAAIAIETVVRLAEKSKHSDPGSRLDFGV